MYNHNSIEKKWQKYWLEHRTYQFTNNFKLPKYYVLDMFPYPSGQGLHVGHLKGYTATDVLARFKRLNGFNVLHPIGWDAFGLPAEQYAIQTHNHPKAFTQKNIDYFRQQLQTIGYCYDYNKEVNTTDPNYYKWTQWIFSRLFKKGLAEIQDIDVNWCGKLQTVLSNEEVLIKDGKMVSERGDFPVIKKPMQQWVLKITEYADKLLEGLNDVDWPDSLKSIQEKWIGKSTGTIVKFKVNKLTLDVFTTRVDTLYGVTFLSIAPENSLVKKLVKKTQLKKVTDYIKLAKSKTDLQRKENKDKTGVFTGTYAVNPINNEQIPIYVADYVLNTYATGIVMGVPAHDQRDFDFAKEIKLPIKFIIETKDHSKAYEDDGKHINSEFINGLNNEQAKQTINKWLKKSKLGEEQVAYKLKDWIFSRQRYWGEPFPIIYDKNNKPLLVTNLPVLLPETNDIKPSKTGKSPLANLTKWVNVTMNHHKYIRETNTMPQWAGSCWYYLGYLLKQPDGSYLDLNSKEGKELFKRWMPIDLYVGGQEHAVLHLLYARFWYHFLFDIGVVSNKEPFNKIVNQGMILGPDGEKMSKSKGNIVNPDEIIKTHGADALRLYEMFMGPITATLAWNDQGLDGMRKWLDRVYRLFTTDFKIVDDIKQINNSLDIAFNKFIKTITKDINEYNFNVAISQMMIYINACYDNKTLYQQHLEKFLIVLSCFTPHLAEELWHEQLKNKDSIFNQSWPTYDENKTIDQTISLPVQENGKLRAVITINRDAEQSEVEKIVMKDSKVINFLNDRKPRKIIYVKNKILNIII